MLIIDPPGQDKGIAAIANREVPAGTPLTLQLQVPGTDPTRGRLQIWPQSAAGCNVPFPASAKQAYDLGMAVSGSGDSRVLSATVPPLQIATSYCVHVALERGLSDDRINALADAVATNAPVPWTGLCQVSDTERQAAIVKALANTMRAALAPSETAAGTTTDDARIQTAAGVVAAQLEFTRTCAKLEALTQRLSDDDAATRTAAGKAAAALNKLPSGTTIRAWPIAVVVSATATQVTPIGDATITDQLALMLSPIDPDLARLVANVALAPDAPQRAAALTILRAQLARPPIHPLDLALYLPSKARYVTAAEFDLAEMRDALVKDLVDPQRRDVILNQLLLLRGQDPKQGGAWLTALTDLARSNADYAVIYAAQQSDQAALDDFMSGLKNTIKGVIKTDAVRALLRETQTVSFERSSQRPLASDEKAAWISANFGVMAAVPLYNNGKKTGFDTPWLTPYFGVAISGRRVDRVIDPYQLVGDSFWLRNSVTIGALLSTPTLNGKAISGPWNAPIVPLAGFGHRLTQYIRFDLGVIPFKFVNRNPTVIETSWGAAFWLGASIDADLWAVASGKLGK